MTEIEVVPTPSELVLNVGEVSDLFGVNVLVTKKGLQGWYGGGVAVRRKGQERLWAHGSFSVPGTRSERLVTITGVAWGTTRRDASDLVDLLNSVMAAGTLGKITVNDPDVGTRWANCYLTGTPDVEWDYEDTLTWTLDVVCTDPRKYGIPLVATTGVTQAGGGLMFPLFTGAPFLVERTNLATNPAAETSTVNYSAVPGPGGAATVTRPATGGKMGAGHYRQTWTTASSGPAGASYVQAKTGGAGDNLSGSLWVRANAAKPVTMILRFRNGTTPQTGTGQVVSAVKTLVPNTWTEFKVDGVVSTGAYTNVEAYAQINAGTLNSVGNTLDVDGVLLEDQVQAGTYFDGNTLSAGNAVYSWSGAQHASTSTRLTATGVPGILDFGVGGSLGAITFDNIGTADVAPLFKITGYTPYFTITEVETGRRVSYEHAVPYGQTLWLNSADGTVMMEGISNRSGGLSNTEWPTIPGSSSRTYLFESPEGRNALMTLEVAPAWW